MTDPVNKIGGAKAVGGKNLQENIFKGEKRKRKTESAENDNIDISEEARDRASGKKRKNILEYIQS